MCVQRIATGLLILPIIKLRRLVKVPTVIGNIIRNGLSIVDALRLAVSIFILQKGLVSIVTVCVLA